MKFRTVIFKCKVNEIVHVRERLDEIAAVTEGKIWFETILQSESGTYAIICHYPESQMEIIDKYYENKVRNIQNALENELDSVRSKLTKYTHIIQGLTGRPIDEIVKSWDICDNGFGVNYRFKPNGHSTLDISMSRTKREIILEAANKNLEKENEELKKRLKSAEQSDYVTPLRDRVDVCEEKINELVEKINEHESDLDNAYTDLDIVQDKMKTLEADLDDAKKRYLNDQKDLEERLDTDFDDVYAEFQSTKDQVNDINMGYIKWSSEVSQFDERIEKLEDNMKELANNGGLGLSFNLMNARIVDNKHRSEEITRRIDILEDSIRRLQEGFCEFADDTTLNTEVNEKLDEKVSKLEDDLLENTKVIADLAKNNVENKKLKKEITALKVTLENLKNNRND